MAYECNIWGHVLNRNEDQNLEVFVLLCFLSSMKCSIASDQESFFMVHKTCSFLLLNADVAVDGYMTFK